ncbi:putative MCAK-like kinesin [Trypanosoma grayi]|uniref:putative MCAK-like kinesin n=1 Tax=Trypanosoma grayi TaxID=71804 RepID=UPI0004F401B3|nr:putative MCAK-like kinesin [Trypanosoma grayi]KEG10057.1 putative MCAK-like kinesin [Trypanosoma grayi]
MPSTPRSSAVNSITVAVRKRPKITGKESEENDVVRCEASTTVVVYEPKTKLDLTPVIEPSVFSFDHVFDEAANNAEVYETCCRPLLQDVKSGNGAVVFAFGQTGSGKTYTMLGCAAEVCQGLYSFTVTDLLTTCAPCTLAVSFYEVYGSKLFDLLNSRAPVKMLQDEARNIHILGLTEREVSSDEEVRQLMSEGQLLRASGATHANDRSSRSHAVLEIRVRLQRGELSCGRITFVDLAGSERAADTADTDIKVRREGAEINKSLLALKECIRAMSLRKRHIPFRASKLTQILRESFVGRCKTCVIANISPCQRHCEDTLNTLRYAYRIKELKGPTGEALEREAPTPCVNCGLPVFAGGRHVCRRLNVQCPHCRQEMDKKDLETHLTECKECPLHCPHCNELLLRGELLRHNRRCAQYPVRCPLCSNQVQRKNMERHTLSECSAAKEKCRYCGVQFPRYALGPHELECDMMKLACPYCLRYIRRGRFDAHAAECVRNPCRKLAPTPQRSESNLSCAPSVEQRRLGAAKTPRQSKMGREFSAAPDDATPEADVETKCPYSRYGCTCKISRASLAAHLAEAVATHLDMVSVYAERMDVENAALRRLVVSNGSERRDTH